jgi:cold shock CspA family protein
METFGKKEKEKNKKKKRQEKEAKKLDRKSNNSKGGSLESMMAYVDEFGNIIDAPVDPATRKKIDVDSIEIGVPKRSDEPIDLRRGGKLIHFNSSKGYGFIKDLESQESLFVHNSEMSETINENDFVTYERSKGQKGWNAVKVKKGKL